MNFTQRWIGKVKIKIIIPCSNYNNKKINQEQKAVFFTKETIGKSFYLKKVSLK